MYAKYSWTHEEEDDSEYEYETYKRKKRYGAKPRFTKNQIESIDTDIIVMNVSSNIYYK